MTHHQSTPEPGRVDPAVTDPAVRYPAAPGPAGAHPAAAPTPPTVDDARPFGAHLRMSWWRPLIIIPTLIIALIGLQFALTIPALIIEIAFFGRDPLDLTVTPLLLLATNLSLAAMAPLSVLLMAWIGKVPWRTVLSSPRRLSGARWGVYFGAFSLLVVLATAITALIDPVAAGFGAFAITGTSIALVAIAILTTPLQAGAEEIMFRGAIMPSIASWIRPVRPALVVGLIASSVIFGLVHFSIDPWLLLYYTVFGVSMALMAVISRGLEAPIAFHVTNNVILMVLAALFAGGGGITLDRSVGVGGPIMLVFVAMDLLAVGVVWLYERRRARITA